MAQSVSIQDQSRDLFGRSAFGFDPEAYGRPAGDLGVVEMDRDDGILFAAVQQDTADRLPLQGAPGFGVVFRKERHDEFGLPIERLKLQVAAAAE